MEEGTTFVVSLEESLVPFNLVELHETLSSGNIDETSLLEYEESANFALSQNNHSERRLTLSDKTIREIPSGYQKSWLTSS